MILPTETLTKSRLVDWRNETTMTRKLVIAALFVAGALMARAATFTQCPPVGADALGCQLLITVTAIDGAGAATAFTVAQSTTDTGPFDNSEDTLIGITNSASGTLTSVFLDGGAGSAAFGFDGDGACTGSYSPGPTAAQCGGAFTFTDPADYGSAGASFGTVCASKDCGTVLVNLANGKSTWFDLEGTIQASQITSGTPEPGSVVLLGSGLAAFLGLAWRRRRAQQ
jgi:hypothetical protein